MGSASGRAGVSSGWAGETPAGGERPGAAKAEGRSVAPAGTPRRPRAAEAGRAPRQAGIGAGRAASRGGGGESPGLAASKVSRRSRGRPSFPGSGRGGDLRVRTVSEGSGAPSPGRPRASIAPNSDSNLGGAAGLRTRAFLATTSSSSHREQAPGRPGAQTRARRPDLQQRPAASAHADAGRSPGAPSPVGQLNAGRRRCEVGPARRCPRQRQVWELH